MQPEASDCSGRIHGRSLSSSFLSRVPLSGEQEIVAVAIKQLPTDIRERLLAETIPRLLKEVTLVFYSSCVAYSRYGASYAHGGSRL